LGFARLGFPEPGHMGDRAGGGVDPGKAEPGMQVARGRSR